MNTVRKPVPKEENTAFKSLMGFMAELEARKWTVRQKERQLFDQLVDLEANLDEAFVNNRGDEAQAAIDALRTELVGVQRELQALERPSPGGTLGRLTKDCWDEATRQITVEYRAEWNAELAELEKARTMFLAAVSALGAIKRKADGVTARITEAVMASGQKMAAPSLSTGIISRPDRKQGPIFMDEREVEKTFYGRNR